MGSICFKCKKATPFLCAWIDRGDSEGISFSETASVVECERYEPGQLPATMIDGGQALQVAGMIIVQAVRDLDDLHKRVSNIRGLCSKGTKLTNYLNKLKQSSGNGVPFSGKDDFSVLEFFEGGNRFAADLLDYCEINGLPAEMADKINDIKSYQTYCMQCVK